MEAAAQLCTLEMVAVCGVHTVARLPIVRHCNTLVSTQKDHSKDHMGYMDRMENTYLFRNKKYCHNFLEN